MNEPKIKGSKDERWAIDLKTGRRRRIRPTRHTGSVVNEELTIRCPRWIDDACEHCDVCGEKADQISLGVTWADGERKMREVNPDGGFRSRGPVLFAMHVVKLDRFAERHFECGYWAPKRQGGDVPTGQTLPQYLIWAYRFGTEDELLSARARADRAGVSKTRIAEQIGPAPGEEDPAPLEVPAYPANLPGDEDIPF